MFTAMILYLLIPNAFVAITEIVQRGLLQSMAVGFIALLVMPIMILLLALTLIGLPLALLLLLMYLLLLFFGYFSGVFYVADQLLKRMRKSQDQPKKWHLLSISMALLVLLAVGLIPLLGSLLCLFNWYRGMQFLSASRLGFKNNSF